MRFVKWLLMSLGGLWLLHTIRYAKPPRAAAKPEDSVAAAGPGVAALIQQSEDQFFYSVVSRALDRRVDGNHFFDTLFFALIAAQAAIYAIILDKLESYAIAVWVLLLAAFGVAVVGVALSIWVVEAPDPQAFVSDFPDDPVGTRSDYVERYILYAKRNDRLQLAKFCLIAVAGALTLISLVIATAGRAGESQRNNDEARQHRRILAPELCEAERVKALGRLGLWYAGYQCGR